MCHRLLPWARTEGVGVRWTFSRCYAVEQRRTVDGMKPSNGGIWLKLELLEIVFGAVSQVVQL